MRPTIERIGRRCFANPSHKANLELSDAENAAELSALVMEFESGRVADETKKAAARG